MYLPCCSILILSAVLAVSFCRAGSYLLQAVVAIQMWSLRELCFRILTRSCGPCLVTLLLMIKTSSTICLNSTVWRAISGRLATSAIATSCAFHPLLYRCRQLVNASFISEEPRVIGWSILVKAHGIVLLRPAGNRFKLPLRLRMPAVFSATLPWHASKDAKQNWKDYQPRNMSSRSSGGFICRSVLSALADSGWHELKSTVFGRGALARRWSWIPHTYVK